MYACSGCNFSSDYRSTIVNHINKVKKCSTDLLEVIKLDTKIKCDYCEKELYDKNTSKRHLKICKKKIKHEHEEIEKKLQEELKKSNDLLTQSLKNSENMISSNENVGPVKTANYKIINIVPPVIHIYLLQEREYLKLNMPIYKIGFTTVGIKRFQDYPKGSKILLMISFDDYNPEKFFIDIFKSKFRQCTEIGLEYFEGDELQMKHIICSHIFKKSA